MNSFQNRQGENLNKKVFQVNEVQRDGTGEIVQIKGNLYRDDSEGLIQEGTPLEAETLTEIVKALAKEVVISGIEEIGDIRTKLRALINTIAINYTDNSIASLREELQVKIEEIATRIVEKHVGFNIYESDVELLANGYIYPSTEIYIPIKENVVIEFINTYDSLFRYEYGQEGTTNFVLSIQAINEPEEFGTCEYRHEFNLKSLETGEIVTKAYVNIRYTSSSTTPED